MIGNMRGEQPLTGPSHPTYGVHMIFWSYLAAQLFGDTYHGFCGASGSSMPASGARE